MLTFVWNRAPNRPFTFADVGRRRWDTAPTTVGVGGRSGRAPTGVDRTARRAKPLIQRVCDMGLFNRFTFDALSTFQSFSFWSG
jgi:hypothetical protein